jgi:hypothetical protein
MAGIVVDRLQGRGDCRVGQRGRPTPGPLLRQFGVPRPEDVQQQQIDERRDDRVRARLRRVELGAQLIDRRAQHRVAARNRGEVDDLR